MPNLIDLTGNVYGRLTVISFSHKLERDILWNCRCECGKETKVRSGNLKNGHTKSCGCLGLKAAQTHGECANGNLTKEYRAFRHMIERCYKPKTKQYHNYGGRGIKVCDRWLNSYSDFLNDVGRAPTQTHSIDRKNNDGNYEPGNCRWATRQEQSNNTTINKMLLYKGETKSLTNWCREFRIKDSTVRCRLKRGWSVEDALTIIAVPMRVYKSKLKVELKKDR